MDGVFGSLTFGGSDLARYIPNNVSFNLSPDVSRDIVVSLNSISLTDATRVAVPLLPNPILTFIDSTLPYIYLPLEACEAFEIALGLTYDSTTRLYSINDTLHEDLIANNPTFTFNIGDRLRSNPTVDIVLPYASFDFDVASYPRVLNTTRFFPLKRSTNDSQYTLGREFLQEACVFYKTNVQFELKPLIEFTGILLLTMNTQTFQSIKPTLKAIFRNR